MVAIEGDSYISCRHSPRAVVKSAGLQLPSWATIFRTCHHLVTNVFRVGRSLSLSVSSRCDRLRRDWRDVGAMVWWLPACLGLNSRPICVYGPGFVAVCQKPVSFGHFVLPCGVKRGRRKKKCPSMSKRRLPLIAHRIATVVL